MPIVATLVSVAKEDANWKVVISYSNGVKSVVKSYNTQSVNDAVIKGLAVSEIASYKRVNDSDGLVTLAPDAVIDTTVAAAPVPTAEELAERQWNSDFSRLVRAKRLVDTGVILATNTAYVALAAKVKAGFLPRYL